MSSSRIPEDEPFNHTTVTRHGRSESSTNLLHNDSNDGVKDGGYDAGYAEAGYGYNPSEYNLHDKSHPATYAYPYGAEGVQQQYSDMGETFSYTC